jgi:hypothetical protein
MIRLLVLIIVIEVIWLNVQCTKLYPEVNFYTCISNKVQGKHCVQNTAY